MSSYSTYISSASKAGDFSTHWNCHHCSVDYHHLVVVGIIILVDIDDHKDYHKLSMVFGWFGLLFMKEKPHLKRFYVPRCDQPPLFNLPRQAPVQKMTTHIYRQKQQQQQ